MSTWAAQRRATIIFGFLIFIGLLATAGYWLFIFQSPTCFDGIKNGDEFEIDCGGSCAIVCPFQAADPNIVWSRGFETAPGVYNFVAVVENPNLSLATELSYVFRAFDEENAQIAEVSGKTPIYPGEEIAIFQPTVQVGQRSATKVFLEIIGRDTVWQRSGLRDRSLFTESFDISRSVNSSTIKADIVNRSLDTVFDVVAVAVVYGTDGNVIQSSRTFIEQVPGESTATAFFSWRERFPEDIGRVEVILNK